MKITVTVNGTERTDEVEPRLLLVHYIREVVGQKATNIGCDTTSCGACTVLMNGESIKSCTVLAVQADGAEVTTVEGLAPEGELHPMQQAFRQEHGLQCGFCTPGMVMASVGLLKENANPTEREVREGLEGNFCRCTGYHNIVRAVLHAAKGEAQEECPMIPAKFDYVKASSVTEALQLMADSDDAKFLAGGHSLLPMMKMRLVQPATLIDIGGLPELSGIKVDGDELVIGAATTHAAVSNSAEVKADAPLLAHAAAQIGDPQIRHRGTIGGSLAHADPAADLPMAVAALGASFEVQGPSGTRVISSEDFFVSYFETDIHADEILTAIRVPRRPGVKWGYQKFTRRSNDWAIVGVAAIDGRVAMANMGAVPIRATATEQALKDGKDSAAAAALAAEGTEPSTDMHADREFRMHLARVLTKRALDGQAS